MHLFIILSIVIYFSFSVYKISITIVSSITNILIVKMVDTYFDQQRNFILILFILLINFFVISLTFQAMVKKTLETFNKQYYYEQLSYKLIEISDLEMQIIRHDLRNTIIGAKSLLDEKKYDELDDYWSKILNKFNQVDSIVRTDNKVLNSILNYKVKIAKESHITVDCEVSCGMSMIESNDLCILIGNIFDNAIEACQKVNFSEKNILCEILQIKNYYNIIIKNSYNPCIKINAKYLHTSKANKTYHGFGMNSIKRIVNKYNGIINIEVIDNWFSVNISFPFIC